MKKYLMIMFLSGIVTFGYAQKDFNRWSIETNAGFNKAMAPLTAGYLSPTLNIGHFDLGVRYMFNEKFGIKGTGGIGSFSEAKGNSPEFSSNYGNISLQAVFNWGRILNFETFSRRLTVLGFFGGGTGYIKNDVRPINDYDPDYVYTINTGFATLFKLSNRVSLEGDISMIVNGRQRFTLDGTDFNSPGRPVQPEINYVHATGTWWTGTLGLNIYLGKQEEHADWYIAADKYATKVELASAINEIKDLLKDSDGDSVSDYLDKESNTPVGARVNFSGVTLDSDNDGTPDHLDKCPFIPGSASLGGCPSIEIKEEVDFFKKAINENYVNVYFAFDSDKPLSYSVSSANFVANFLKRNPGVKLEVKGYADELGPEDYNIKLSEKRAKVVYDLLISAGIDSLRLSFKGYGEDTSVDKSSTEARQLARRSSFEVK
jgi:OOP family OmpA-OmpF porin